MARKPTSWTNTFIDFQTVTAGQIALNIMKSEVLDMPVGAFTLRRLIFTFAVRLLLPTNSGGMVFFGIEPAKSLIDAADYAASDFTGDDGARWLASGAIPIMGLASDSTTANDLMPFNVVDVDTKVMRKIGQGRKPFLVVFNEHASSVSFIAHARMLWSRT